MQRKRKPPFLGILCITPYVLLVIAALVLNKANTQNEPITPTPPMTLVSSKPRLVTARFLGVPKPSLKTESTPERIGRYANIDPSQKDIDMLAKLVYLEARDQSPEGQQAIAEVVLNRVLADNFPDTIEGVIYDEKYGVQFTPAHLISATTATQAQYDAVEAALYGECILDDDVVYFSTTGENDRVWGIIGDHAFCRQYVWE